MTTFTPRNLSHNAHTHEPDTEPARREWWCEQLIELAHSAGEPRWLGLIGEWLRPDLCAAEIGERVTELLDLADEIACGSTTSEQRHCRIDQYAALLTSLATPVRPSFDDDADRAIDIRNSDSALTAVPPTAPLALVRGGRG